MFDREELLTRILCDTLPPVTADGAYLFGQTEDNQESVFLSAQELVSHALVRRILISDAQPKSGYPGGQAWRAALMGLGISGPLIEEVPVEPTLTLNTLIEAESLMRHAKNKNYGSVIVIAAPFHQERAFMTAVSVAIRDYSDVCIYSYPGRALSWDEEVVHSQGTVLATRAGLILGEQERINKYQKKGDLASYSQVLSYLRKRDIAR
ncbi:MAG: YdcF family protein [Nitrospiraceae bacterium]|jgi:uncharacterized SAM-binding protein YcdF (DUF218 family)|nr:MAG: YdcF family protein [Nitrospiraceae bacterium]